MIDPHGAFRSLNLKHNSPCIHQRAKQQRPHFRAFVPKANVARLRFKTVVIPVSRAEALIEQTIIKVWPYIERVHENIRFRIRRRRLSHPIHDSRDKRVCLLDRNSMRTWLHCRHGSSGRSCEPDEMRTDNAVPFDFRNALHRTEPPATPTRRSLKTSGETNGLNVTTAPSPIMSCASTIATMVASWELMGGAVPNTTPLQIPRKMIITIPTISTVIVRPG